MRKLTMAAVAAIVAGGLPAAAAAADAQDTHQAKPHRHHVRTYEQHNADPAVRDGYVMNGGFDWRRRGERRPWYAHGYSEDCVAWEQHAYHYACDPNGRY